MSNEDVVYKIEHDHREVEGLFAEFKDAPSRDLALKICEELEIHTAAEESAVYPVLEEDLSNEADKVEEAEQEHQEARGLIEQVRGTNDLAELVELMNLLEGAIAHHVAEEENEMLPKARRELPERELEELGEAFEEAKDEESD
jgi:hemerythrin-like domain-containing protein